MFQTSKTGAVHVIRVEVPLNLETCEQFSSVLTATVQGRPMAIVDLSGMPLIDSKGLEELLEQHDHFTMRGGALKLAGPTPMCSDVLRITGVSDRVETHDDVKDAIASFLH